MERLNFVVEDAQLMEMTAIALSTSLPHWSRTTGRNLRRLHYWTTQQLRLCLRCLQDLRADAVGERGQRGDDGAALKPVGGWTFDESVFLHAYSCALLTTTLVQVSRVTGAWSTEEGLDVQREEVVSAVKALSIADTDGHSQLHPVLHSSLQQLVRALTCEAGELKEWLTLGCVSGVLLNAHQS